MSTILGGGWTGVDGVGPVTIAAASIEKSIKLRNETLKPLIIRHFKYPAKTRLFKLGYEPNRSRCCIGVKYLAIKGGLAKILQ